MVSVIVTFADVMQVELPGDKIRSLPTFHAYTGRSEDEVNETKEMNKSVLIEDGPEISDLTTLVVIE